MMMGSSYLLALCLVSAAACIGIAASSSNHADYAKSLLIFKQSLTNTTMLHSWREPLVNRLCSWNTPLWTGCLCSNGSFIGLRLEGMGLGGRIDVEALSGLPIYSLSVAHNNFSGLFPDVRKLRKLRSLYLSDNGFEGEMGDDAFSGMKAMRKVVVSNNYFRGNIPTSLLDLPSLQILQLQDNMFRGRIPNFSQDNLAVNFSNNKLRGSIPVKLSNQNATSFYGNLELCGRPLSLCKPNKPLPKTAFIAAAVAGVTFSAFLTLILIHRRRPKPLKYSKSLHDFDTSTHTNKKESGGKLCFVRNNNSERFELDDLLRASAQVLGGGSFGSSYKAVVLGCHYSYVVRRFRRMSSVGRDEFCRHMRTLGRLSHPNLLPLVAFHFRKDEKLLITKFVQNGSLASHLHGKRASHQPGLDWPTRLRIIKGVARGLAYLYKELPTLTLPHGHLKSSNVLLDNNYQPLLADYALAPVMNKDHAEQLMAGYKSPVNDGVITRKADVWCLGILILELLTGQFPASYLKQGRGPSSDLATWVGSVGREEWNGEVFDKDMNSATRGEAQMLGLLKIGMCCCEWDVERRWDLREAVDKILELETGDS
ncbi:hypothetical protein C2S52_008549 [Perilla frutescens var. hirtella]|nr:hypothetical protein C2S52_008549 [Perilla frutescens var. hirtella]